MVFHLKTDVQSETANQKIKRHLYTFINYQQDDWPGKLAMAKFAANNNKSFPLSYLLFLPLKACIPV